jgi:D-serine deaminase-like pyridoxal phosphate-dependent protein
MADGMSARLTIGELATPALVVDAARAEANCRVMREKARASGVAFRPHVKTHKTAEIGRLQHGGAAGPITVSTMAEAEFFARAGFRDITWAVPVAPDKLDRVAALARQIDRLNLLVDHEAAVDAIEDAARRHDTRFDVFLEIDCGYHRSGVEPGSAAHDRVADRLGGAARVAFRGVLTHAGHSYRAAGAGEIVRIAAEEREALDAALAHRKLTGEGLVRSVGSTPTASVVERFEGVDEVRPGNYVFYDAFQAAIGSCAIDDCAALVLTTVVSLQQSAGRCVVDAGALALSKDRGAEHLTGRSTYGVVLSLEGEPLPLRIEAVSQEHGHVAIDGETRLKIGTKLLVIPNHSCLTAAMFDRYHVVDGVTIVDEWRPARGW